MKEMTPRLRRGKRRNAENIRKAEIESHHLVRNAGQGLPALAQNPLGAQLMCALFFLDSNIVDEQT